MDQARLDEIRREIAEGTYVTDEKLKVAAARAMEQVIQGEEKYLKQVQEMPPEERRRWAKAYLGAPSFGGPVTAPASRLHYLDLINGKTTLPQPAPLIDTEPSIDERYLRLGRSTCQTDHEDE